MRARGRVRVNRIHDILGFQISGRVMVCFMALACAMSCVHIIFVYNTKLQRTNSVMITPLTPDSFLRHREEEEIAIGLKLLASPETSTNEGLKSTCTEENLLNRVLVREHLGIANVAAEEFFEQKLLPFMKKKHVLLDIGANTGQFSIPMASRGHRAVSFEPSQSTCKILRGNMERANVSSLIVLHCAAADSEVKSAIFHQDPNLTVASGNKQITSELAQKLRKSFSLVDVGPKIPLRRL